MSYYYGKLTMVGLVIKCVPTLERDIVFQQSEEFAVKSLFVQPRYKNCKDFQPSVQYSLFSQRISQTKAKLDPGFLYN